MRKSAELLQAIPSSETKVYQVNREGGERFSVFPVAVDSGRQIDWIRHSSEVASAWKFGGAPSDRGSVGGAFL